MAENKIENIEENKEKEKEKKKAKKKFFTITEKSKEKKVITIDTSITPTADEKKMLDIYLSAGWTIRVKSKKRAANAKKRAEETGFGKKKKADEKKADEKKAE